MNSLRFLLLEDSPIDADLIQAVLLEGGLECDLIRVQTQADFLTALEHQYFDLILADYSLPTFDGISALEIAHHHCPDIPFIFVSGTLGEEVAVEMLKGGATDYVLKQRLERLIPSVQRALQEAQERVARQQAESQLQQYAERLRMTAEASRRFSEAILDLQALLDTVCSTIGSLIGDICILQLLSDDEQRLQINALYHPRGDATALLRQIRGSAPSPAAVGLVAKVLTTQQPLLLPFTDSEEIGVAACLRELPYLETFKVSSLLIVPLWVRGRSLGCLCLAREQEQRPYTLEEQAFLQDLADRAALAIDNARLYQKSQETNRLKDEFLAMLSHELRSPLNAIIGWLSLLRSRRLDKATVDRALETVERNAKAQARLVEDLLDVSRILQGKLRLNLQAVKLQPLVEAAVETVRPTAEAKAVILKVPFSSVTPEVSGDPERLQQVVWNLLSNAVKFTPSGGQVSIELTQVEEQALLSPSAQAKAPCMPGTSGPRCYAQITIRDTGQGIKPEFLPHIFERFRQADSSITRNHGGLGLGLAIVQHLVELHGGTVQAHSPGENQGATFTVKLPLLIADPLNAASADCLGTSPADVSRNAPRLRGLRILIVDSDLDARMLLVSIFKDCGAEVVATATATAGLGLLSQANPPFDLLISAIGAPEADGYALLRRVRALKLEQGRTILAIAVTAHAREEAYQSTLSAGFDAHLAKPVNPTRLIQLVAELTGRATGQSG